MHKNITGLGPKEAEFLSRLSASGNHKFLTEDAIAFWGSPEMAWKKMRLLENKGWVERLERGKYLVVPLEAGPERKWTEDTYVVADALVKPAAIAYWTALHHWNWTEQIPRIVYVQTTSRKKTPRRKLFGVQYEFVTVDKSKFFGNTKEWRAGNAILVTDREKTLIDCAHDVERAGTIEELAKAVRASHSEISWQKIDKYVAQFRNGAVKKRLGYLFESLVPGLSKEAVQTLAGWQKNLTEGVVPLQPAAPRRGKIINRWRLLVNVRVS